MITSLIILVGILFVVMYLNGKLADDVEFLTESKENLFKHYETRVKQNAQLIDALMKLGVSPEWDNIDKGYIFFDSKPKKVKKVNKKKK